MMTSSTFKSYTRKLLGFGTKTGSLGFGTKPGSLGFGTKTGTSIFIEDVRNMRSDSPRLVGRRSFNCMSESWQILLILSWEKNRFRVVEDTLQTFLLSNIFYLNCELNCNLNCEQSG